MNKSAIKASIATTCKQALKEAQWQIQEVDERTFNIKVEQGFGGPLYFTIQVKEIM